MTSFLQSRKSVLVLGVLCGILVSGTAAFATVGINSVRSKHVKNNALLGADIKNGTLTALDLAANSVESAELAAGSVTSAELAADSITTADFDVVPAARAGRGANLATVTASTTVFAMDTEIFDTADLWDVANPERLTAPIAGIYQVSAGVRFSSTSSVGDRSLILYKGALGTPNEIGSSRAPAASTADTMATVSSLVTLAAGEYVQARVIQSSGGALNVEGHDGTNFIAMHWVAPVS